MPGAFIEGLDRTWVTVSQTVNTLRVNLCFQLQRRYYNWLHLMYHLSMRDVAERSKQWEISTGARRTTSVTSLHYLQTTQHPSYSAQLVLVGHYFIGFVCSKIQCVYQLRIKCSYTQFGEIRIRNQYPGYSPIPENSSASLQMVSGRNIYLCYSMSLCHLSRTYWPLCCNCPLSCTSRGIIGGSC